MTFTIKHKVQFEEEIKKSRFQAIAFPVDSELQIKSILEEYRDPTTTHQCWAWKIGTRVRFNDDGEPSGTAGRPILAVIEGYELTNILLLVNRWYGGIKLGTGGLVRAYGGCAGQCIQQSEKIEYIIKTDVKMSCVFNEWPMLQYELQQLEIEFEEQYTVDGVEVLAKLQAHHLEYFSNKLRDLTRGRENLHIMDHQDDNT